MAQIDKTKQKQIIIGALILVVVALIAMKLNSIDHAVKAPSTPTPTPAPIEAASPATIEAMKKAGPIAGSPLFAVMVQDQQPGGAPYSCKDADQLRRLASSTASGARANEALPNGSFWQDKNMSGDAFIYYENASRLLVVCDGKSTVSTHLPDTGVGAREEVVKFDQPHFGDWAHDGKFEFVVFRGQCAKGPCIGLFHIFQVADGKLRQLAEVNAEGVDTEQMSINGISRTSLQIHAYCYNNDYVPAFEYIAVLDYGGPQVMTLVPFHLIRERSPELLQRMVAPQPDPTAPADLQAYVKMQKVVYDAYQGVPLAKLTDDYNAILAGLHVTAAPVQCDPLAILRMVSEGK